MKKKGILLIIFTFGLSLIAQGLVALWGLKDEEWDLEAPVKWKHLIAMLAVLFVAVTYLLIKIIAMGEPLIIQ